MTGRWMVRNSFVALSHTVIANAYQFGLERGFSVVCTHHAHRCRPTPDQFEIIQSGGDNLSRGGYRSSPSAHRTKVRPVAPEPTGRMEEVARPARDSPAVVPFSGHLRLRRLMTAPCARARTCVWRHTAPRRPRSTGAFGWQSGRAESRPTSGGPLPTAGQLRHRAPRVNPSGTRGSPRTRPTRLRPWGPPSDPEARRPPRTPRPART